LGNEDAHPAHTVFITERLSDQSLNATAAAVEALKRTARHLFEQADTDKDGTLDQVELMACLSSLHESHGQAWSSLSVRDEAVAAIARYGTAQGKLPYEGFLRLIGGEGVLAMLPAGDMREQVSKQAHKDAHKELGKNAAKAAAGVAVMQAAKKIFNDADADGNGSIDQDELAWLVQRLWSEIGRNVPGPNSLGSAAARALRKFDTNHDGVISFKEFLAMITTSPWDALLPDEVQAQVVPFIGGARESGDPEPGEPPLNPRAACPSQSSNGRLGGGGGGPTSARSLGRGGESGGYELMGPPQSVRVKTLARGHTRDLQYAIQEAARINTRLAETQSRPIASHRKPHAAGYPGSTWLRK